MIKNEEIRSITITLNFPKGRLENAQYNRQVLRQVCERSLRRYKHARDHLDQPSVTSGTSWVDNIRLPSHMLDDMALDSFMKNTRLYPN